MRPMYLVYLAFVLSIGSFSPIAHARVEVPTLQPEQIAGPWEFSGASGIDGIFFNIETGFNGQSGGQQTAWQAMNVRVYHRQGGVETWGWFATDKKATPDAYNTQDEDSFTLFDGERLRIRLVGASQLRPFDLDITFSPTRHVWTGSWSRAGQPVQVVLERPNVNAGVKPNPLVGDWEGEPDPNSRFSPSPASLHIRESSDGALSAWIDRNIISGINPRTQLISSDQRNGELLQVTSATDSRLMLETTFAAGPSYHYQGGLSKDQQVLTGTWSVDEGGSGTLNAPDMFSRVHDRAAR
jgi:hypothetical protein